MKNKNMLKIITALAILIVTPHLQASAASGGPEVGIPFSFKRSITTNPNDTIITSIITNLSTDESLTETITVYKGYNKDGGIRVPSVSTQGPVSNAVNIGLLYAHMSVGKSIIDQVAHIKRYDPSNNTLHTITTNDDLKFYGNGIRCSLEQRQNEQDKEK